MEKILLIGENTPFLESIAGEFRNLGFTAYTAGEEDKALEIITQEAPDVLILPMGIKRFNSLKLVFKLREVNLLSKLVYLHPEDVIPNPPDKNFFLFVQDSLSPDLIVTKIIESIDSTLPMGEMTIREVLWLLKVESQSALIRIFTDEAEGEIFVVDGDPIACKLGLDVGDEALESLIKLESIAYEILWDVPEGIERNIVKDYEDFFGPHIKKPAEKEGEPEESIEDLSKELEVEIQELGIEKSSEELSLDEFPSFEEESWDLGEDTLKELEKEEKTEEQDLAELFKEEPKGAEEFSLDMGEEDLTITEPTEEKSGEESEKTEFEFPAEFTESELSEFPPLEEQKAEEKAEAEGEKVSPETGETGFPTIESEELTEFPQAGEEAEKISESIPEEFKIPEETKPEEFPPLEEKETGFELSAPEEKVEFPTIEGSEFEVPGEEIHIEEKPSDIEGKEFEVPGVEEFAIPEEKTEAPSEEKPSFISKEEPEIEFSADHDLQLKLETHAKGIRGLLSIGILRGNTAVAAIPSQTLERSVLKLADEEFDEIYKKIGRKILVYLKQKDLILWAEWSKVPAGYALYETKKILKKL